MSNLGSRIVSNLSHLDLETIKASLLASFNDYKELIWEDPEKNPNPWFHLLDLIACRWGYYGDLDIHIEAMEKRLKKTVKSFNRRKKLDDFLMDVGTHKEETARRNQELRDYLTSQGHLVISI